MTQNRRKTKMDLKRFLTDLLGDEQVSDKQTDRLCYARDSNFRSTIQAHFHQTEPGPELIAWPESVQQISQIIGFAAKSKVPIVPYGGGSGVCAGATPVAKAITLDLKKLNKILNIDKEQGVAEVQAGMLGLTLENELNRKGFTLGHFPSSILTASFGGYLAARSAGQLSSKYGKIEDMVLGLEFVDGTGQIIQTKRNFFSDEFDLTQAIVGSEGTLGIITKAWVKVYPLQKHKEYLSYSFESIEQGIKTLKDIMQSGIKPDVLRLYDEIDTAMALSKSKGKKQSRLPMPLSLISEDVIKKIKSKVMTLAFHGHRLLNEAARFSPLGCMMVVMLQGEKNLIEAQKKIIHKICKKNDGNPRGIKPAQTWEAHRYGVSYKASKLFRDQAFTDTMEVATTWDNLPRLYHNVINTLKPHCLVLAHLSHSYKDGGAIYFTFVTPLKNLEKSLIKYDEIWELAMRTVQDSGGVLSHHHGIGRLKKGHIREEWEDAVPIYESFKTVLDPHKILNPGVLVDI